MLNIKDKDKVWIDFYENSICPGCGSKDIWLDAEGGEYESYKCKDCEVEIYNKLI